MLLSAGARASLLALTAYVGCACDPLPPVDDAGTDAGTDAGQDAARDAGSDAARPDARVDGGSEESPGWERVPGFSDECYFERAERPQAILGDARWEACDAEWGEGCRWLVIDGPLRPADFASRPSYAYDGERAYFMGFFRDSAGRSVTAYIDSDLRVYAGWRKHSTSGSSTVCALHIASGAGFAAVGLDIIRTGDGEVSEGRIWHLPLGSLGTMSAPPHELGSDALPWGNFFDQSAASDTTVALRVSPRAHIWLLDEGRSAMLEGSDVGIAVDPRVVGHDVLYISWEGEAAGESRIVHGSIAQPQRTLHYVPGELVFSFDTDGRHVVWERVTEMTPSLVTATEVWAADFTVDPALFSPRNVRPAGPPGALRVADGTIGMARVMPIPGEPATYHADVIDIDSETEWTYAFPYGYRATGIPIWVDRNEIAVPTERYDAVRRVSIGTMVRIPRAAMTRAAE